MNAPTKLKYTDAMAALDRYIQYPSLVKDRAVQSLDNLRLIIDQQEHRINELLKLNEKLRKQADQWLGFCVDMANNDKIRPQETGIEVERIAEIQADAKKQAQSMYLTFKAIISHGLQRISDNELGDIDYPAILAKDCTEQAARILVEQEEQYTNGDPEPVRFSREVLTHIQTASYD